MQDLSNFAARDIETLIHPYTNLDSFRKTGPTIIDCGEGVYVTDFAWQTLHRRACGPVVHLAWLRQPRIDRGGHPADGAAVLHPYLRRQEPRAGNRRRREAEGNRADSGLEGVLHLVGVGGQRQPDQARVVLQQCARPAAEEEDHQPHPRLSRRHHRLGEPHRACRTITATSTCRSTGCCIPRARTTTASARPARARRISPPASPPIWMQLIQKEGAGHRRRLHRRAGDGRWRRHRAAEGLLREDPGGARQIRHPVHRRRSDLRLWPHRQHVRLADVRHRSPTRSRSPRR